MIFCSLHKNVIGSSILKTVGENCERIILFGSYAYGTPVIWQKNGCAMPKAILTPPLICPLAAASASTPIVNGTAGLFRLGHNPRPSTQGYGVYRL
jgi:hypothetical protein